MPHRNARRSLSLAAAALLLAACSDTGNPVRPEDPGIGIDAGGPATLQVAVTCTAYTETRDVRCGEPALPGGVRPVILGGQNQYVQLTSSNRVVTADTFAFDVTVTNLIPQPLGTTNGSTADPAGVRVFFSQEPVSAQGAVTVANPDGAGVFTAANQPYYQYAGLLPQDSTTAAKTWKFATDPAVTSFSFTVYVTAEVQYPDGYITGNHYVLTLDPGEVRALPGVVRNVVGTALPGEPISWVSSVPEIVSVSGTQATAGASRGFAEITGTSGPRGLIHTTAVSVCQSTVVGNGTSSPQSIAATDCFSSFGSNSFRPSTSYYGDLYRVALTAGQTITITLDTGDDLDTYVVLVDPLGLAVAVNDDDEDGTLGVGSKLVYTAPATGVYVFEASTFNGLDTGNYTLGVTIN